MKKATDLKLEKRARGEVQKLLTPLKYIKETDPLFGVLTEEQVGVDPLTGRRRIAEEVLQNIRQYLLVDNGDPKLIKEERAKKTVLEAEKDPLTSRTMLRLEQAPLISRDLNKEKGPVFEYDSAQSSSQWIEKPIKDSLVLTDAVQAGKAMLWNPESKVT
ncbi:hypothetical protein AALP_AAs49579U000100, partial [Arabis alpina]